MMNIVSRGWVSNNFEFSEVPCSSSLMLITSIALSSLRSAVAETSFLQFFSPSDQYDDGFAVTTRRNQTLVASWSWDPVTPYQCQLASGWEGDNYTNSTSLCSSNGVEFPNAMKMLLNGDPVVGGRISFAQNAIQSAVVYRRGSSQWTKIFAEYGQTAEGVRAIAEVFGLAVDSSDSVYSVGHVYFYSFNETTPVNAFITRQASSGALVGARILKGSGTSGFYAVASSGGNLTAAGAFYEGDYGQGLATVLLARFSSNLNLGWVKVHAWLDGRANAVVVSKTGMIYVSTHVGQVIIKSDPNGDLLWAKRYFGVTDLTSLALSHTEDLIFGGAKLISGDEGAYIGSARSGGGQLKWALSLNPGKNSMIRSLATDDQGAVYAVGYSYNQAKRVVMFGKFGDQGQAIDCPQVERRTLIMEDETSAVTTSIPDLASLNWTTINFTDWTGFTTQTLDDLPLQTCFGDVVPPSSETFAPSSSPLPSSEKSTESTTSSPSREAVDLTIIVASVAAMIFAVIVAGGVLGTVYYVRRINKLQADLDAAGTEQENPTPNPSVELVGSPTTTPTGSAVAASAPIVGQYMTAPERPKSVQPYQNLGASPAEEIGSVKATSPNQYENVPERVEAAHQYQNIGTGPAAEEGSAKMIAPHQYENVPGKGEEEHQYQNVLETE